MLSPATLSEIQSHMTRAKRYMEQNREAKIGSTGAIDFALCSIAESLQALTALQYHIYSEEILKRPE